MTDDSNQSLLQLVYVSAASVDFSDSDLDRLLEGARSNNSSLDVTGVLLFVDGTFLQVLEGEPRSVRSLYAAILQDTRHTNAMILAERSIDERNFGDWSMGFVRGRETVRELPGFVDFFAQDGRTLIDLHGASKRVDQILDGFHRGRWRRQPASS